ncbi:MFS transporter [Streptomyces sp. NPDC101225]|uniref:MFS transporter n=1 Tax=Streptomyces sp. NPDC101225 TaxID=3366135 RepID=UPI003804C794
MNPSTTYVHARTELIRPGRWRRRAVLLLGTLVFFVFGYDLFSLPAVSPSLLRQPNTQVTAGVLGVMASVTALGAAIGGFMANRLSDTYGRRATIASCAAWISGCMLFTGLTSGPAALGVSRFLLGIGLGVLAPLVCVLVVDWSRPQRRSLYCGIAQSGIPVGSVAAASTDHFLPTGMGLQWVFLIGALPILLAPLCWSFMPVAKPTEASVPDRASRRDAQVVSREWWGLFEPGWAVASILFSIASMIGLLLIYGVNSWLPTLMAETGHGVSSALMFVIAFNSGAVVVTLLFSMIADWVPAKLCVVTLFLCATAAMRALTTTEGHWAILGTVTLAGGGILGSQNVICAYVARYYPHQMRGTALGFTLGIGRFGSIVGPSYLTLVIGVSSDPTVGFYFLVVPALVGALAILLVPRGRRPERPSAA